jgi:phenylpropionate dioxygenase-like ring-hydroxylating dioxygenase large terminal subunit
MSVGRGLFRVQPLWRGFYPVLRAHELRDRPLPVVLWGKRFVLFRDGAGLARALVDRCPHRNVALSRGRVTAEGHIECPYHGWCFDGAGSCVRVPGRVQLDLEPRAPAAQAFEVREDGLFIWLCPASEGPLAEPFALPHHDEPGFTTVVREVSAEASLFAVVENALDVPHTAILHRGLFRGGERSRVRVVVRRGADHVEAEYQGEPAPRGVLGRLLALGSGEQSVPVEHWDRFFLPGVLQVEYRLGRRVHFVVTGLCVPTADQRTRLFAVASFRTPLPGRLLALVLLPLARWVFAQDARLLAAQTENVNAFGGEEFASTELDALGPSIWRLLRQAAQAEKAGAPNWSDPAAPLESTIEAEFELDA